ncbi:uncharacterized protein LOC132939719 [Metopolophium dirhodum]|uniref:uncharacterized protein LOC132939719 n=1 Tax=Metopolophium dirhodum TaxID=44670 RepID=UPI00298F4F37|nr:uncharacterized protein LOC132939719 [Metopolophium dirhodum]
MNNNNYSNDKCKIKNNTPAKTEIKNLHKDNIQERQPKTCQELWRRCEVLCSSINPLERIKYQGSGCCRMSPIPTTDDFKLLFEPLFSRRTTFAFYKEVFHVDQRCTCMKFNGIEEECKHPECKQNLKCLSIPLATCSPAENWKKYYGQTS